MEPRFTPRQLEPRAHLCLYQPLSCLKVGHYNEDNHQDHISSFGTLSFVPVSAAPPPPPSCPWSLVFVFAHFPPHQSCPLPWGCPCLLRTFSWLISLYPVPCPWVLWLILQVSVQMLTSFGESFLKYVSLCPRQSIILSFTFQIRSFLASTTLAFILLHDCVVSLSMFVCLCPAECELLPKGGVRTSSFSSTHSQGQSSVWNIISA